MAKKETTREANARKGFTDIPDSSKDTGAYERTMGRANALTRRGEKADNLTQVDGRNARAIAGYGFEQAQRNAAPKSSPRSYRKPKFEPNKTRTYSYTGEMPKKFSPDYQSTAEVKRREAMRESIRRMRNKTKKK
jgi:hypothetical protein